MAKITLEIKRNESLKESKMLLGEYLNYWLHNYAKPNTSHKTFAEYKKIIKTHIQPSLGHIMLNDLKSTHLQEYYRKKLQGLTAQLVLHHHRILSKSLNDAIGWEFISRNVAKGAKSPKPVRKEMKTLSVEQLNLFVKTAKEKSPVYFPILFATVHTEMRKSELIGINWENVDFTSEKFYIRQTITVANGKYFFNNVPKNEKPRAVRLTAELKNFSRILNTSMTTEKNYLENRIIRIILCFVTRRGISWLHLKLQERLSECSKLQGFLRSVFMIYDILM
ncbi:MAG: site-specific integrase [Bacillus sp. (in: Bacteria)]|nr:site-specific integrase [Bacillus sp. (in: firmicutes)]